MEHDRDPEPEYFELVEREMAILYGYEVILVEKNCDGKGKHGADYARKTLEKRAELKLAEEENGPDACGACGSTGVDASLRSCSKCHVRKYCNQECQKLHWKMHKKRCAKLAELKKDSVL